MIGPFSRNTSGQGREGGRYFSLIAYRVHIVGDKRHLGCKDVNEPGVVDAAVGPSKNLDVVYVTDLSQIHLPPGMYLGKCLRETSAATINRAIGAIA
jgi:hypothetical protein